MTIQVGRERITVSGDDLAEVLRNSDELRTMGFRLPKDATLTHRTNGGHDYYEAVRSVRINGQHRKAVRKIGQRSDGSGLFIASTQPWEIYDPETRVTSIQFDPYILDKVLEMGFDKSATEGFVPAVKKNGEFTPA